MDLAAAGLDPRIQQVLRDAGYAELWPSQAEAVPLAARGDSILCCIPTASGKSLVAFAALLQRVLEGGKGLYIVPLRALADEKGEELRQLLKPLGARVRVATGDYDAPASALESADIIVATSEKADAMMRQGPAWLRAVRCVVADEVHLVGDANRGPTLEVVLTRVRSLAPEAQRVALSATVRNAEAIAEWLGATLVRSDWRPVPLREGILYGNALHYADGSTAVVGGRGEPVDRLVLDGLQKGGQVLVFVNTRRSAEAVAARIARALDPATDGTVEGLEGDDPVSEKLAAVLKRGAAFHHAGLDTTKRRLVERLFRSRQLKVIVATPTLAAGVNLPARRVVIRDLARYDVDLGMNQPIPVLEYKQMAGRAGRPRFDTEGEAITIAKTLDERDAALRLYLNGTPERVESRLFADRALRVHVLATVAGGYATTVQGVVEFFQKTLAGQGNGLDARVEGVLHWLERQGLLQPAPAGYEPTPLGQVASRFYLDPLTALTLRQGLQRAPANPSDLVLLHLLAATPDLPVLFLRSGDAWVEEQGWEHLDDLLAPQQGRATLEEVMAELKTAFLLQDWIDEKTDRHFFVKYQAYPGDVHAKVETATWLAHGLARVAALERPELVDRAERLERRLDEGVREELLPLVSLRGIGRVRARALHDAGYPSVPRLRAAPAGALVRVPGFGPSVVKALLQQLGREGDAQALPDPEATRVGARRR